jgi:hypothetical protein
MGTNGRAAMTTSTKKDHATPTTTAVSTAEARATTRLSHKESISIYVEAEERQPRQQEAPAFVRTTSGKLLRRVSTSNSLHKVPTLSWPLCLASSTNLTTAADKTAIMYWYRPIYNHMISSHLCSHKPTSSTFAAKNRELTIQPTEDAATTPANITEVAEDNSTTAEVTREALVVDQEVTDIDQINITNQMKEAI